MDHSVWEKFASPGDHLRLALESALDSSNEGVWDFDLHSQKLHLSPACYVMLGLEPGVIPSDPALWLELVFPEDRERASQAFIDCLRGGEETFQVELRVIRFDVIRWIKLRGRAIRRSQEGDISHLIGVVADITEQRQMEEELRANEVQLKASEVQLRASESLLRESEAKYRILFQTSPDAYLILSLDGLILDWNEAARHFFNYSDDEFVELTAADLLPPHLLAELADLPDDRRERSPQRAEIARKGGGAFTAMVHIRRVQLDGEMRAIVSIRDITRQEQTQVNLARQLRLNEALMNALPVPVFFKNPLGRYMGCNRAYTELTGLKDTDLNGKTSSELRADELTQMYHNIDLNLIQSGGHLRYEAQFHSSDGSLRDAIFEKEAFQDENGQPAGLVGTFIDITERKRAEKIQASIYRISEAVQTVADLDELYREIHTVIGRLMHAKNFYIALYDEASELLTFPYYVDEYDSPPLPGKLDRGLTSYVFLTGKALLANPDSFHALVSGGQVETIGADSLDWLGVPLKTRDMTIGVMAVQTYTPDERYTESDQDVLGFISNQVALAIERKRSDEQIRSLNRTLQTISQVNQVLVRAVNEEQLMQRVCQILVETGGYPLAWIGLPGNGGVELKIAPAMMAGFDAGYMAKFSCSGLCGEASTQALRTAQAVIVSDLPGSRPGEAWCEMGRECGYNTAIILPLVAGGQAVGVVHVYSPDSSALPGDEMALLAQMADDLAFGITTLRDRIRRQVAEQELRQREAQLSDSEEKYRSVVERANDGIAIIQDFRIIFANYRLLVILGVTLDEVTGRPFSDFIAPSEISQVKEKYRLRISGEEVPYIYRTLLLHRDGREIHVEINAGLFNYQGRLADLVLIRDISEQIRVEEVSARRLVELEAINRISTALRTVSDLDEMLMRMMDETLSVMHTNAGALWLYNPDNDKLRVVVARGWFNDLILKVKDTYEGIGGIVFRHGQPYYSADFATDPNTREQIRDRIPAGWGGACIPIFTTTTERMGIFYIAVPPDRPLTAEDKHLLSNLAEIAGNAVYRTRLLAQAELHVQRLNALHNFDIAISSSLDLRVTMDDLLSQVITQLAVDAADVLLLNERSQFLEYAAGRGLRGSSAKRARLRLGEGFAGKAALDRQMVAAPDLSKTTLSLSQGLLWQGEDFHTYYGFPLIAEGRVEGVLEVFHRSLLTPDPEWLDFLETLAGRAAIAIMVSRLFESLHRSNAELRHAYDTTIEGLTQALELRDLETKNHGARVMELTIELAQEMNAFSEDELIHIRRGALLHDIGKMGVPDAILLKNGKLTEEEWVKMRMHPQYAIDILSPIPYLKRSLEIPYCHHEKWDGTGYPQGLKGEQIPLAARIFAVIDVWDALSFDRPYRDAWPQAEIIQYIKDNSGRHFDPQVVEAFLRCYDKGHIRVSGK